MVMPPLVSPAYWRNAFRFQQHQNPHPFDSTQGRLCLRKRRGDKDGAPSIRRPLVRRKEPFDPGTPFANQVVTVLNPFGRDILKSF